MQAVVSGICYHWWERGSGGLAGGAWEHTALESVQAIAVLYKMNADGTNLWLGRCLVLLIASSRQSCVQTLNFCPRSCWISLTVKTPENVTS